MDKYQEFVSKNKLPKYRYDQIIDAVYRQFASDYAQVSNLPKSIQQKLSAELPIDTLTLLKEKRAADGSTIKHLLKTPSGAIIESVLMQHSDGRNTVCVSCMSGCPVGCTFCATGQMGFRGNLTGDQIVEQVLRFARTLQPAERRVTNVVFMGMGEPLLNLGAIKDAISVLTDENKFGIGGRRITVSTSGYIPQLQDLIEWGYRGRIAISLHAPNQQLREELMPVVSKVYPLDKLLQKLDEFVEMTHKRITYEYILIKDKNDLPEHAEQLITLFKHRLAHINLIPYNPVPGPDYKRTEPKDAVRFQNLLRQGGLEATIRVTMGADIDSACGQLAGTLSQE
ncbi:23S rRNA (adenine(2503)-C(2))-methyltransferase RlmN [Candidatus Dojkabacteria bacterium]|uniref:23S rRNA (Adenine(2503)-C(2))-methyltransferase RlmN n=1 Tax=Candidatus Dojkabacteria bacterium TaxID=2099670 RepID=A0A955I6M1_9BACT|nr:23S rRNA (adenine(2503)-C(2))-methyltransferase RlmN [Candidatus Dojkabacteria bacterium]